MNDTEGHSRSLEMTVIQWASYQILLLVRGSIVTVLRHFRDITTFIAFMTPPPQPHYLIMGHVACATPLQLAGGLSYICACLCYDLPWSTVVTYLKLHSLQRWEGDLKSTK